ncbi:chitinase 18-18 [Hypoxylon crocopeplum]|nr:chitinase 18-18 [Hypoxylon crocopeplum]
MQFKNSVLVAALSASSAFATYTKDYKLNTYWGQSGPSTEFLGTHCESDSVDYVTLAFVNNSPEHGNGTDYPGTNFAAHCAAEVYVNNNRNSKLLSGCSYIKDDIRKCQNLGKKVFLSVGGEYTATSNYSLSSVQKGYEFAEFLYKAFGPYKAGYTGPRPLDRSSTDHTCLDGFDFDIETKFDNQQPYIRMVNHLRELINNDHKDMIITAAPQCPQSTQYFQMKTILQQAKFDKIWVQFYNNPSCEASSTSFNYNDWESFIDGGINDAAELYIGLPGSAAAVGATGSGYITPTQAKTLICAYKNKEHFGGAMLWDAYYASENKDTAGKPYLDAVAEALKCGGCAADVCAPPASTSSSTSSYVATTSSSVSTSSYAATSSSASTSSYIATSSSSATSSETCTDSTSSSYIATSSSSYAATNTESSSSYLVTSSTYATTTSSASYSASTTSSEEDDCPPEDETTSSYIESSTVSVSATTTSSVPSYPTTSSAAEYTTSTVYTTTVYTVTSCAPSVTNCPSKGAVVTETIALYTTVCPVTATQTPTTTTEVPMTTSTIYSTRIATITKCPASVTNCPVGSVTTETIAVSTTVCPVSEAETTTVPTSGASYPTGGSEASPSKPVKVAAVPSYPASSFSSSYVPATTLTVAVYPTGGKNGTAAISSTAAAGTGTGYPIVPTTTSAGYSVVVCSGAGCSTAYPTASVVTAGSAKTASLGVFGLVAIAAFVL